MPKSIILNFRDNYYEITLESALDNYQLQRKALYLKTCYKKAFKNKDNKNTFKYLCTIVCTLLKLM